MATTTVLLHKHTAAASEHHEWVLLPGYRGEPVTVQRDAAGRKHKHAWRHWLVLICNNTECDGRAAISADFIESEAQRAVPVPR